jgi:hypothetical protein
VSVELLLEKYAGGAVRFAAVRAGHQVYVGPAPASAQDDYLAPCDDPRAARGVRASLRATVWGRAAADGSVEITVAGLVDETNVDAVWWAIEMDLAADAPRWTVDFGDAVMYAPLFYELGERCARFVGARRRLVLLRPSVLDIVAH